MPIDLSAAWKTARNILNGAIMLLPKLILAFVIFMAFSSLVRSANL